MSLKYKPALFDTFGDKPQCLSLGNQSRKPERLKWLKGLVALSVNTEDTPLGTRIYRKQTPIQANRGIRMC